MANNANALQKFIGLLTSASRTGIGQGVDIARKISGQTQDIDPNTLDQIPLIGKILRQNTVDNPQNPFLTKQEQSNPLSTTGKSIAGAATYAVPFGKATGLGSLLTKILLPGAAVGGLQALTDPEVSKKSVARGAVTGAAGAGAIAGGSQLLEKILSSGAKGLTQKLPEQLMTGVFKEPLKDTRAALKGGESLGKQALDRGIKGTDESIYNQAIQKINSYEDQLQASLSNSKRVVPLSDIKKAAQPLIEKYAKAGNTSAVSNISDRITALEKYNGKAIPVSVANEIKRTLYDEARGGYGKLASENIEGVKAIAKALKEGIASKVPGADAINKELSVNGKIADSLIDKMARSGRNNLMGLTDSVLAAGGIATGNPATLLIPAAKNVAGSTLGKTNIANLLKAGAPAAEGISKASSALSNPILQQMLGQIGSKTGAQLVSAEQTPQSENNNENYQSTNTQFTPPDPSNSGDILTQLTSQGVSPEIAQQFLAKAGQGGQVAGASTGIPSGVTITPEMASMAQILLKPADAAKIKAAYQIQQSSVPKEKQLSGEVLGKLSETKNAISLIPTLNKSFNESKDVFGPVKGRVRSTNPYDTEAKKAESTITLVKQIIGKGLEGGVLRKEDESKYENILPKLTDTQETVQNKLNLLQEVLNSKLNTDLQTYKSGGYNTSGGGVSDVQQMLGILQQQGILGQ